MYKDEHAARRSPTCRRWGRKARAVFLALLLLTTLTVGGTIAYLVTETSPVINTFTPSRVACEVSENFDGATKRNVNVRNTGDTEAYIRVKLVSYRANDNEEHIGGTAGIPVFAPGKNWVGFEEYYYYTLPVAPGGSPVNPLIGEIVLAETYADADGGKQVIEVMAEAIQSGPAQAAGSAWGVTISEGNVTAYSVK